MGPGATIKVTNSPVTVAAAATGYRSSHFTAYFDTDHLRGYGILWHNNRTVGEIAGVIFHLMMELDKRQLDADCWRAGKLRNGVELMERLIEILHLPRFVKYPNECEDVLIKWLRKFWYPFRYSIPSFLNWSLNNYNNWCLEFFDFFSGLKISLNLVCKTKGSMILLDNISCWKSL